MDNSGDRSDEKEPRENDQKNRGDRNKRTSKVSQQDAFRGDHKDLQGFTYTYDSAARANQYDKTTKKITEWVEKELTFCKDIWRVMSTLKEPDTNSWKPTAPDKDKEMTKMEESLFNEEVKEYVLRKRTYENNTFKVYSIVLGQCSEAMKAKLEGQDDWEDIHEKHDLLQLLKSIKVWMLNQQSDRNPVLSTYSAIAGMFKIRQNRHEELPEFRKRFVAAKEVLEHIGVSMGAALTKITDCALTKDGKEARDKVKKELLKRQNGMPLISLWQLPSFRLLTRRDTSR